MERKWMKYSGLIEEKEGEKPYDLRLLKTV